MLIRYRRGSNRVLRFPRATSSKINVFNDLLLEYVKICSLYGAGFYYMPGTDICLKIGGYVRAEMTYGSNGNFAAGPTSGEVFNRTSNEFVMRARAYITADAREQTAWGTARAYVAVG